MKDDLTLLEVDPRTYRTPFTDVPDMTCGTARLKKHRSAAGIYPMEGVRGYGYFQIKRPMWVTELQQRGRDGKWHTWMVDDPLHWYGTEQWAKALKPGSVLVAGLGLGLVLHHLHELKHAHVTVVDINPDVIEMIGGLGLPRPAVIQCNDFYSVQHARGDEFDNLYWDLAVGSPKETRDDFMKAIVLAKAFMPTAQHIFFGLKTL